MGGGGKQKTSAQRGRETRVGARGQGKGQDVGQSATNALLPNFREKTSDVLNSQCSRHELPLQRKAFRQEVAHHFPGKEHYMTEAVPHNYTPRQVNMVTKARTLY
ncbi:hypothetical protein E2C01_054194 [Portunus trituberculatus]|uniref:Uncharacterized protein n=1 Tax=Portunus trituberculatus TaxID=210409 RepID=A0A5B7GRA6_PORTR|nr:hypothetical protein [Portunus trituberculatus]